VATITRNSRPEGNRGEHVECLYSDDAGATWSTPVKLEPGAGTVEGLTNAYSSLVDTEFGRLYVSYNINLDNVTHFPNGQSFPRDDTQGAYVARWSDDGGETWSSERIRLPIRTTSIDRNAIEEARTLAREGRAEEAAIRYRLIFGAAGPPPAYQQEYFSVLAGTQRAGEEGRRGLERLAESPSATPRARPLLSCPMPTRTRACPGLPW
jgi:hypothetical protein